jgi:hypothetical protein
VVVDAALRERRERVFIVLAAVFLGSMTLLNVVGITHWHLRLACCPTRSPFCALT